MKPTARIREAAGGVSQRRFAKEAGVSPKHMNRIEGGNARCGASTALKIADRYPEAMQRAGVTVEDLVRD